MKKYIKASDKAESDRYARKLATALKDNIAADISYDEERKLNPRFEGYSTNDGDNIQILAYFQGDMMEFNIPVSDLTFDLEEDFGDIEDEVLEYIDDNYGDEDDYY